MCCIRGSAYGVRTGGHCKTRSIAGGVSEGPWVSPARPSTRPSPVPGQPLSPRPLYLFAGGVPWIINDGWGPGGLSGHTRDMTSIERVGFFHFGSDRKDDPVGSLAAKIAECAAHQTGNSLMVLPEAFNVRGGLYAIDAALDLDAISRLQALSVRHGITFVAGIIDRLGGSNLACLIDGNCPPVVLSRKQAGGRDCLYTPSSGDHTIAALQAGIGITALVCDDAGYAARAEADRARVLASQPAAICPRPFANSIFALESSVGHTVTYTIFTPGSPKPFSRSCNTVQRHSESIYYHRIRTHRSTRCASRNTTRTNGANRSRISTRLSGSAS